MTEAKVLVDVIDDLIEMAKRGGLGAITEDLRAAKNRAIGEIALAMADSHHTTGRIGELRLVHNQRQLAPAQTKQHHKEEA